jgi:hypothetical protein
MRHQKTVSPPADQVAAGPVVIQEQAVYTVAEAQAALKLRRNSLKREIREGRLTVSKRCGRYYLLGKHLLAWLEAGERKPKSKVLPEPGKN